jgi:hypothetical protein
MMGALQSMSWLVVNVPGLDLILYYSSPKIKGPTATLDVLAIDLLCLPNAALSFYLDRWGEEKKRKKRNHMR